MNRTCFASLSLLLSVGCIEPPVVPPEDLRPRFAGKPPPALWIAVVDERPYVLSGDKEPWFEGLIRQDFGIPATLPRDDRRKSLAHQVGVMLQETFWQLNTAVSRRDIPPGSDWREKLRRRGSLAPVLALTIRESKFDWAGRSTGFWYDYELVVADGNGRDIADLRISDHIEIVYRPGYTVWDQSPVLYAELIGSLLADPAIEEALGRSWEAVDSVPPAPFEGGEPRAELQTRLGETGARCGQEKEDVLVCSWRIARDAIGWEAFESMRGDESRGFNLLCIFERGREADCAAFGWSGVATRRERERKGPHVRKSLARASTLSELSRLVGEAPAACKRGEAEQVCS